MYPFDGKTDDELIAESQALGVQEDAIRSQRQEIRAELDRRINSRLVAGEPTHQPSGE